MNRIHFLKTYPELIRLNRIAIFMVWYPAFYGFMVSVRINKLETPRVI